jgi:hypothetical protein
MSRPIRERLRQLETEVQDLRVLPAAAVRARGRRRGRRQLAVAAVAVAVVATTAGVAATRSLERPYQGAATPGQAATQPTGVGCSLALPADPAMVRIRVLGGGGAAGATATQLRKRRFAVLSDDAATTDPDTAGSATLRYGPAAIGAAALLKAVLRGDTTMRFDPDRQDDTVDLTLGAAFAGLATTTEMNQNLVAAGEPTAPPQCPTGR